MMKKLFLLALQVSIFILLTTKSFSQGDIYDLTILDLENVLESKSPSYADEVLSDYGFLLTERDYWENNILPWDKYIFAYKYNKDSETAPLWITIDLRDISGSRKNIKSDTLWKYYPEVYMDNDNYLQITGWYYFDYYTFLTNYIKKNYQKDDAKYFDHLNAFQYYYSQGSFKYRFYRNTEVCRIIIDWTNEKEEIYLDSISDIISKYKRN